MAAAEVNQGPKTRKSASPAIKEVRFPKRKLTSFDGGFLRFGLEKKTGETDDRDIGSKI
jgi:hypothetical protein